MNAHMHETDVPSCTGHILQDFSFHPHHEDVMQRNGVSDSNVLMKGKEEREEEGSAAQGMPRHSSDREEQPSQTIVSPLFTL